MEEGVHDLPLPHKVSMKKKREEEKEQKAGADGCIYTLVRVETKLGWAGTSAFLTRQQTLEAAANTNHPLVGCRRQPYHMTEHHIL